MSTATPTRSSLETRPGASAQSLAHAYVRPNVLFVRGHGSWLEDENGERYLDMTSGIAVNALGHGSPLLADALRAAADGLIHVSNLYHTAPAIELASELVERSFARRVFFANSGSEANEGAIKFARLAAGPERRDVVYFDGSFHGRTFASLAATDRPDYREPFEPLPPGFRRAAWDHPDGLAAIDRRTAAVLLEPIQGEAGVRVPSAEWVRAVRRRCDEVGALLVFDEVQCGLGRTGRLFAYEGFGVVPDMLTLAKPLAGGLPMGAVLLGERVESVVRPGCHGTTFGGGPFVSSVALRVVRAVGDPAFLADVRRKGERLVERLAALGSSLGVRGRGLMIGVQVPDAARLNELAFDERLLLVPAQGGTLRFLPPLTATEDELDEAVHRFGRALERYRSEEVAP